jgi:hypothetical protein
MAFAGVFGLPGPIAFLPGILLGGLLYFLPTLVGQSKRNAGAIFALNLLLGWTVIGWVIALVWAMTVDPPVVMAGVPMAAGAGPFCSACGTMVGPQATFCTRCGRRMA